AGIVATVLAHEAARAAVPAALMDKTFGAAMCFATGNTAAAGTASATVVALAEGVLKAMFVTKLKVAAVLLLVAGAIGLAAGAHQGLASAPAASVARLALKAPVFSATVPESQENAVEAQHKEEKQKPKEEDKKKAEEKKQADDPFAGQLEMLQRL